MKQAQCDSAGNKYKVMHRQDIVFSVYGFSFKKFVSAEECVKTDFSERQDLTPEKCRVGVHTVSFARITGVLGARGSIAG
jgi:hypothetical protein